MSRLLYRPAGLSEVTAIRLATAATSDTSEQFLRPIAPSEPTKQFRIDLQLGRDRLRLTLAGKLDIASAGPLRVVLASLNRLTPPVHVSTGRVAVTDAHGLRPLFETVRYREAYPLPPLVVVEFSDAVRRLLTLLDVPCTERLDVDAWDRAYRRPPQPHERRRGHLRLVADVSEPDHRHRRTGRPADE